MKRYKTPAGRVCSISEESGLSKDEQAARLNISKSVYYRATNKYDPDVRFALEWLEPFCRLHKDWTPLEVAANNAGYLLVKMPRGALCDSDICKLIADYQGDFSTMICTLINYLTNEPNVEAREALLTTINQHIAASVGMKKRIEKDCCQYDMFQED